MFCNIIWKLKSVQANNSEHLHEIIKKKKKIANAIEFCKPKKNLIKNQISLYMYLKK